VDTTSAGQLLNMEGHGRKLHRTSPANGVSVAAGAPSRSRDPGAPTRLGVTSRPSITQCRQRPSYPDPGPRHATPASTQSMTTGVPPIWTHAALVCAPPMLVACCQWRWQQERRDPRRASTHPPGQEISARRWPQPPGRCDLPATRGGSPPSVCGIGPCWAARWRGNIPREILSTILLFEIYVYHYHPLNSLVWLVSGADLL
jgi:hypothetical protein